MSKFQWHATFLNFFAYSSALPPGWRRSVSNTLIEIRCSITPAMDRSRLDKGSVVDVGESGFHRHVRRVALWLQSELATKNRQWVFVKVCEKNRDSPTGFLKRL